MIDQGLRLYSSIDLHDGLSINGSNVHRSAGMFC